MKKIFAVLLIHLLTTQIVGAKRVTPLNRFLESDLANRVFSRILKGTVSPAWFVALSSSEKKLLLAGMANPEREGVALMDIVLDLGEGSGEATLMGRHLSGEERMEIQEFFGRTVPGKTLRAEELQKGLQGQYVVLNPANANESFILVFEGDDVIMEMDGGIHWTGVRRIAGDDIILKMVGVIAENGVSTQIRMQIKIEMTGITDFQEFGVPMVRTISLNEGETGARDTYWREGHFVKVEEPQ